MKTYKEFIIEARRRMRVLNTTHYTSGDSANSIRSSGFRRSPSDGAYHSSEHDVVYTTPSRQVGGEYGHAKIPLRIVNPRLTRTKSPKQHGPDMKHWVSTASDDDLVADRNKPKTAYDQAKSALSKGSNVVFVPDAHGGPFETKNRGPYVVVDRNKANKSIVRTPNIRMRLPGRKSKRK